MSKPWWYVEPKEPVVCPDRPSGFVPFDQYDTDFKYPLMSSREAADPLMAEGCDNCASPPLLPECPTPEPPEET